MELPPKELPWESHSRINVFASSLIYSSTFVDRVDLYSLSDVGKF